VLFLTVSLCSCADALPRKTIPQETATSAPETPEPTPDKTMQERLLDVTARPTEIIEDIETAPPAFDLNNPDLHLLERDGDTQYAWIFEDDDCVLYSMDVDGSNAKKLAAFEPGEYPYTDTDYPNSVVDFGLCGDWIILCVGHYEGTARIFYGDFVRMKKDGSELEHFRLTDSDDFEIIDDWIYYNYEYNGGRDKEYVQEGCWRIRSDGTEKEYLGDIIGRMYFYGEDGYIYGTRTINNGGIVDNLICCKPDGSDLITLFSGEMLLFTNESDFMGYTDIEVTDEYITFTAMVRGYGEGDSWRGHIEYSANYQVRKDGSELTLLHEETY
jgi:hypothetical protein